ncbi:MAG: hypothetical protein WC810_03055 [Janthinobacterium sp.]|jgi:hypothetical protein
MDPTKEKPKAKFVEYDVSSDTFSDDEQNKIVKLVIQDIEADEDVARDWIEDRKKDLQMYNGEKPSIIEGLNKKAWQSDRNLDVTAAVTDSYQSTLLGTTWNPDSIHYIATQKNEVDNKDNRERFTKWAVGKNEIDFYPSAGDYIRTKSTQGISFFKVYWRVWYEWVDRRMLKKDGSYDIKTEKKRFEKAVIENKDNLDDILVPRYGCDIQKLPHIIDTLHLTASDLLEYGKDGTFINVDERFVNSLKSQMAIDKKTTIEKEKASQLNLNDVVDVEFRALPIDIYEWYGYYKKNGKYERYRFHIERVTGTFLSGKPLRKIRRDGKYPFVGGPFIRIPGQLKGKSLPALIKEPTNALNAVFNQKQDFQYVTNCPFGFMKMQEGYTKNKYELEPMVMYPVEGNPGENVLFPNLSRSMAWAESDIRLLFEIIEKLTGAASYFMSNDRNTSGTATRDMLVAKQSENRFGQWVNSIQQEFCEAIDMAMALYDDWAPKSLAERILGEDGKQMFRNFSPESIRYNSMAQMEPDVVAGSKSYEKQIAMWALETLTKTIWLDPRMNPKGNWLLVSDAMKRMGIASPDRYLPPEPKPEMGTGKEVDNIFARLMNGEVIEPELNWNPVEMLAGLRRLQEERYFDLDPEYRVNFDDLIFKVEIMVRETIKRLMEEQASNELANRMISGSQGGQPMPQGTPGQMGAMPQGMPIEGQPGAVPTTEAPVGPMGGEAPAIPGMEQT